MKRVFEMFEGVHVLIIRTESGLKEKVLNMTDVRRHILNQLGPPFEKIYDNAA